MTDFDVAISRANTASSKWERYRDRDVLPFWVADMDFPVAPPIHQALTDRIRHPFFGYTIVPDGLSDAVISHLRKEFDWHVDPSWIVWLPAVVTGLAVSCRAYCQDGDDIVVNPPVYHSFFDSHEKSRQNLVRVPLHKSEGRWTYDMAAMAEAFTDKTRLFLMCSPHNPTGTVFTVEELKSVATLCRERDVIIVSDEIHCDLVIDSEARHRPIAAACTEVADRTVTLMSGSKTWNLAGLNCSFAIISNPELRKRFTDTSRSIVQAVPPLAFTATLAAFRDGESWRRELLAYLAGNYQYLKTAVADMPGLSLQPLQATYLAWIDATGLGLDDVQGFFEEHGVGLSSGKQFGVSGGYVRLNFACPRVMLEQGVQRMNRAIAGLSGLVYKEVTAVPGNR